MMSDLMRNNLTAFARVESIEVDADDDPMSTPVIEGTIEVRFCKTKGTAGQILIEEQSDRL
jgi:hypothetical protein